MRDADIALYRAKEQGKNRIALFDTSMGWEAYSRLRLRTQLESAVENDELRVLFQPIISLGSSEIVGVEALVRWEHPKLGTLSPSEFVPIAEESALITLLGRWVLQQACAHAAVWNRGDREPVRERERLRAPAARAGVRGRDRGRARVVRPRTRRSSCSSSPSRC